MSDNLRATKRASKTPPKTSPATPRRGRATRGRSKLWPAGVHIAPYLSPTGRFVLVAIGEDSFVTVAAEVSTLEDHRSRATQGRPDIGYPTSILEPQPDGRRRGSIPFLGSLGALNGGRPLDALLWPRGVHLIPWRDAFQCGDELGFGRPMVAIDARRRVIAEMMVPDGADPEPVRRDLAAILEAVEERDAALAQADGSA